MANNNLDQRATELSKEESNVTLYSNKTQAVHAYNGHILHKGSASPLAINIFCHQLSKFQRSLTLKKYPTLLDMTPKPITRKESLYHRLQDLYASNPLCCDFSSPTLLRGLNSHMPQQRQRTKSLSTKHIGVVLISGIPQSNITTAGVKNHQKLLATAHF